MNCCVSNSNTTKSFRYTGIEKTMILINNSNFAVYQFSLKPFQKSLSGYTSGTNVITNTILTVLKPKKLNVNLASIIK